MAASSQAAVGTAATVLVSAPIGPGAYQVGAALLLADASTDVYLGGANVGTGNGFKLAHGGTTPLSVPLFSGDSLYAVVATGSATVGVLQMGA
jgi:hypothetical protein